MIGHDVRIASCNECRGNRAEIGTDGILLETRREAQNIILILQLLDSKDITRARLGGPSTQLRNRARKQRDMFFVMALKLDGECECILCE